MIEQLGNLSPGDLFLTPHSVFTTTPRGGQIALCLWSKPYISEDNVPAVWLGFWVDESIEDFWYARSFLIEKVNVKQ